LFVAVALASQDGSHHRYWNRRSEDNSTATLYLLEAAANSDMAVCLDGSPGGYYFRPAPQNSSGVNKWYIHHQGGGWCTSLGDCYSRSQSALGSSKSYTPNMDLTGDYFSTYPEQNPMMYNWNAVFLMYCDGASFSGSNSTVSSYQGHNLYFRGHHVLNAMMTDLLENRGLSQATDVVISGCSAGGLATFLHVDEWRSMIPTTARVVGMPDSGFFLDYETQENYAGYMQWVFVQQNTTSGVNADCIAYWTPQGQPWKCIFAQHTAPHISTPIFPLQSEYDSWQTANILGSTDPNLINPYGDYLTELVKETELTSDRNGIYLDSCWHHCTSGMWNTMVTDGVTMAQAFQLWYNNVQNVWQQGQDFPCTSCCPSSNNTPK